jgi:O-methyltransferase involved in polyketide biosynthesis
LAGPEANVIYSDIDPVTVEYGREILKDNNGVRFVRCDAGKPEELLNSGVVQEHFAENRKLAIGFNGIAYFLPDEKLKYALQILYNWAGKGSKLFFCDADADASEVTDKLKPVFELYAKIGQPIYIRSKDKLLEMAKPWNVDEPGFQTLDEWIGMGETVTQQEKTEWGGKGFYGAIFSK